MRPSDPSPGQVVAAGRLLAHVAAASGHAERLGGVLLESVEVLNKTADALMDAGQLDSVQPLLERALHIAQSQVGEDHPATLVIRGFLAHWLGEAGRVQEAAGQFEQLLADRTRVTRHERGEQPANRPDHRPDLGHSDSPSVPFHHALACLDHIRGEEVVHFSSLI